jgi:hypothetical protein
MTPYTARLTEDILSTVKRLIYAKKDDIVTIVADHDNVLIADKKGVRFPVQKSKVEKI